MQVRLLASIATPDKAWHHGDTYDCSAEEAHRLIERELAEPLKPEPPIEAAVRRAPRARP